MTIEQKALKQQAFDEFFSIEHHFELNIAPLEASQVNQHSFMQSIPLPFKVASEVMIIDQSSISPLNQLKNEASQLVKYLNLQSQKINLLVSYILQQENDPEQSYLGVKFGGGGIIFETNTPYTASVDIALKLFFTCENIAIFCYGEIIEEIKKENTFQYKVVFTHIQAEDREQLVRTSLHIQSKALQKLAQERSEQTI